MSDQVTVDIVSQTYSFFKSKDNQIQEILDDLLKCTESFTDSNSMNLKVLLSSEFILMKARLLVTNEYNRVKTMLYNDDLKSASPTIIAAFKKREQYLISTIARLNEIRQDFEVISKTAYSLKINPLS